MSRLLIVSNRLPVTVSIRNGAVRVDRSMGGLATGLAGPHERTGGEWIGWPGTFEGATDEQRAEIASRLDALHLVPVELSQEELHGFYEGYSNELLWPLFHYMLGHVAMSAHDWETYERVNRRFAEITAARWKPGDLIWVHDYQLLLVPGFLRELLPEARIGFFLHIPFPSSAVFRGLPHREEVLTGMLGADLLGFHTASYLRHFSAALLRSLGQTVEVDRIAWQGREVHLGVFPMGVDAKRFDALARTPSALEEARQLRGDGEISILLGIDRLDYTKGIVRRLLAFECVLARHPELREHVRLIQVAVPSRATLGAYQETRARVDTLVARINGAYGTPHWTPIHYLHKGFNAAGVAALCRAADVLLVTPVRDGMNLVAKEFVACRSDEDGVLVLSELAGAAQELGEALIVNPYDVDRAADVYVQALRMPREERRRRMRLMRARVAAYDVHRWADCFIERLELAHPVLEPTPAEEELRIATATATARAAEHLELLLDYDGTLRGFEEHPSAAVPDVQLLDLLHELIARKNTRVHIVSGRSRFDLERWFGELDLGLHAEHGLWSRMPRRSDGDRTDWVRAEIAGLPHRDRIAALLEDYASRLHGSFVEQKDATVAFHWRAADASHAMRQVNELRLHLSEVCGGLGVQLLAGNCVLEVRPAGLTKGLAAMRVARVSGNAKLVALGDDRTDEDLFAALPEGSIAVHVGEGPSCATVRLADVEAARAFLRGLLPAR